ncbi:hypothetical protein PAMP_015654 [Pampus punctatissimus]
MDGYTRTEDELFSSCLLNLTWENCYEQATGLLSMVLKVSSHILCMPLENSRLQSVHGPRRSSKAMYSVCLDKKRASTWQSSSKGVCE